MLKPEDNDILTQTDRGTPMGDMMRHFWIPFMTAKELRRPTARRSGRPCWASSCWRSATATAGSG